MLNFRVRINSWSSDCRVRQLAVRSAWQASVNIFANIENVWIMRKTHIASSGNRDDPNRRIYNTHSLADTDPEFSCEDGLSWINYPPCWCFFIERRKS